MNNPSNGMTGAVVAVYIAGEAVGALFQTFAGDRLGRIRFMQLMCVIVTIGTIIQTASVNIGMFLAGRTLAGIAVGGMVATVPIYLSEISAPESRGLIGGISGCGISFGTMMSNWVGFACGYAPYGQVQWRLPLGIQIPCGVIMFAGLSTFMPNSPRQLIRKGKVTQAREEFSKIRRDLQSPDMVREFTLMRAQIEYEMSRELKSFRGVFKLYRRRVMVSIAVQTCKTTFAHARKSLPMTSASLHPAVAADRDGEYYTPLLNIGEIKSLKRGENTNYDAHSD